MDNEDMGGICEGKGRKVRTRMGIWVFRDMRYRSQGRGRADEFLRTRESGNPE